MLPMLTHPPCAHIRSVCSKQRSMTFLQWSHDCTAAAVTKLDCFYTKCIKLCGLPTVDVNVVRKVDQLSSSNCRKIAGEHSSYIFAQLWVLLSLCLSLSLSCTHSHTHYLSFSLPPSLPSLLYLSFWSNQ